MASLVVVSQAGCGGRVIYADQLEDDETETAVEPDSNSDLDSAADEEDGDEDEEEQLNCSGDFAEPVVRFEDVGWSPQALSPTRDGLEFFYARLALNSTVDSSGERKITVRRRAHLQEPWRAPESVVELDGVCAQVEAGTEIAGLDVSKDALRLYIACNTFAPGDYGLGKLVVAHRVDRESPFVVDPRPIGEVGYSIAVSRDELTLYATSNDASVDYVLMHTRSSVDEAFGPMVPVPGLPTIRNPEPVPGSLMLLGADRSATSKRSHLVSVVRPDAESSFGVPDTLGLPVPPDNMGDYSPALAGDCRTLYFTRYDFSNNRVVVMESRRVQL